MSDLRQQLEAYQQTLQQEPGINSLNMIKLPPVVRQILRWTLRQRAMTYKTLRAAAEEKQINLVELDEALDALCEIGWLATEIHDGTTVYMPSFGSKAGLSPSHKHEDRLKARASLLRRIQVWLGFKR